MEDYINENIKGKKKGVSLGKVLLYILRGVGCITYVRAIAFLDRQLQLIYLIVFVIYVIVLGISKLIKSEDKHKINKSLNKLIYLIVNDKVIVGLCVWGIVGLIIWTLGMQKGSLMIQNKEGQSAASQLVFSDEKVRDVIIINNDEKYLIYFDIASGKVIEKEKLNSTYDISRIEYNQEQFQSIKGAEKDNSAYSEIKVSDFIEQKKYDEAAKLVKAFANLMDDIREANEEEIYEIFSESIRCSKEEHEEKTVKLFRPYIKVFLARQQQYEGNNDFIDYKVVSCFEEQGKEHYIVYVRMYYMNSTIEYKLAIERTEEKNKDDQLEERLRITDCTHTKKYE